MCAIDAASQSIWLRSDASLLCGQTLRTDKPMTKGRSDQELQTSSTRKPDSARLSETSASSQRDIVSNLFQPASWSARNRIMNSKLWRHPRSWQAQKSFYHVAWFMREFAPLPRWAIGTHSGIVARNLWTTTWLFNGYPLWRRLAHTAFWTFRHCGRI